MADTTQRAAVLSHFRVMADTLTCVCGRVFPLDLNFADAWGHLFAAHDGRPGTHVYATRGGHHLVAFAVQNREVA